MIASLPMYDFPELRSETDALWSGLRRHFLACGLDRIPHDLTRPQDLCAHWQEPDLLFSQTCGYPLTHTLAGRVQLIATPRYLADGCRGTSYCSFLIVRAKDGNRPLADFSGWPVAINDFQSQSGFNILRFHLAEQGLGPEFLAQVVETGGHRKSVAAVREGVADLCAVDCVSWALLSRIAPRETTGLAVIGRTAGAPCLPFITAKARSPEIVSCLRNGLNAAFADSSLAPVLGALLLQGVEVPPASTYELILSQEQSARSRWSLAGSR